MTSVDIPNRFGYDEIMRDDKDPAAVKLGKRGGRKRTPAKAAAARENGKRGGRPRMNPLLPGNAVRFSDGATVRELIDALKRCHPRARVIINGGMVPAKVREVATVERHGAEEVEIG